MQIFVVSFLVLFAIAALAVSVGMKFTETQRQQQVQKVLKSVDRESQPASARVRRRVTVAKDDADSDLESRLQSYGPFRDLSLFLMQAGMDPNPMGFFVISFFLAGAGALIGWNVPILVFPIVSAIGLACALGYAPYFFINHKRNTRFREFEEQFPEALEFLARSMRAGHAFSVSLGMTAEETPNPLGTEFRQTYNEQNLGAPVEETMRALSKRVPLLDVRFFVSAVLLQRRVGGNLAEILDSLAHVIRERFRIKGHVRAVSAHGRITATVLVLLPIFMTCALMLIAPSYLRSLIDDPHGKFLVLFAIVAQLVGFYFIRRIIQIKI